MIGVVLGAIGVALGGAALGLVLRRRRSGSDAATADERADVGG